MQIRVISLTRTLYEDFFITVITPDVPAFFMFFFCVRRWSISARAVLYAVRTSKSFEISFSYAIHSSPTTQAVYHFLTNAVFSISASETGLVHLQWSSSTCCFAIAPPSCELPGEVAENPLAYSILFNREYHSADKEGGGDTISAKYTAELSTVNP